jgi:hypothetical protein
MLCPLCFFCPVSNFRNFSTNISFTGWDYQPHAQPPTWKTRVSLFVWVITFDMSGTWCHKSSITTARIALRIMWPRKPHHYIKVGIPLVGWNSCKNVLPQIFKTKHCISKASSCETAHLRKLQVDICVNVAYISDTKVYKTKITHKNTIAPCSLIL